MLVSRLFVVLVFLGSLSIVGCGGSNTPEIVNTEVQTEQDLADYEAEMDKTEMIEE